MFGRALIIAAAHLFSSAYDRVEAVGSSTASPELALHVYGLVQVDGVLTDQSSIDEVNPSTSEPLNDSRFLVRRARLRSLISYGISSAVLEIDGNTVRGPQMRLIAAELAIRAPIFTDDDDRIPLVAATIGLFKIPFGYEVQERFEERLFIDASSASSAFFPGFYDLGVKVQGGFQFLRYQIALMNGNPVGERAFPGRDPTANKDILGRIGVSTKIADLVRVDGGVSALTGKGFHKGVASTKDVFVWRDTNENGVIDPTELQAIGGTAGTPSKNFRHQGLGLDLRARMDIASLGELFVFGELFVAKNLDRALFPADPVPLARDVRETGFVVGFTQTIFDVAMIGVRFDRYNPDADAREQQAAQLVPRDSSISRAAFTVAWLPTAKSRIALEYDHENNALGRGENGAPSLLANDALTLRGQMVF